MPTRPPHRPRWILAVLAALLSAGVACARSDVPVTAGIGGGGLEPLPSQTPAAPQPTASERPTEVAATPTPTPPAPPASSTPPPTPTFEFIGTAEPIVYEAQPGDTLPALAARFGVVIDDITSSGPLPADGTMISPGQLVFIPRRLTQTSPEDRLIPDSELVFSPHAVDFDVTAFAETQGGYLTEYREYVGGRLRTGPEVVAQVARDNSVNPRLLLALLEHQAGWVTDPVRPAGDAWRYPMGKADAAFAGLFRQLTWASDELGLGYYGWRSGVLVDLSFNDGTRMRLAPTLNAGTVALQYYFAVGSSWLDWVDSVAADGFLATYRSFFGDPWGYYHPLFEPGVVQPQLELPFLPGHSWSFTGGPHGAWEFESAWAALDFAPASAHLGCEVSEDWAVASAPGLVVRSGGGVVVLDLDGDGREQTGWVLIYLHIASQGRVADGEFVETDDLLGHPSCEGGLATGTHIHIARKYNGEWMLADGPLPFDLGGWVAHAGSQPYEGSLRRGQEVVIASPFGIREAQITR